MSRKFVIMIVVFIFVSGTIAHAAGIGVILKELAKQALIAASKETGKSAVDFFKNLFNKDKDIAQNHKNPKLKDAGVVGRVRNWVISPAGNLSKHDIEEIAKTLKTLDNDLDQTIKINNEDQTVVTTQAGIIADDIVSGNSSSITKDKSIHLSNIQGPVTINIHDVKEGHKEENPQKAKMEDQFSIPTVLSANETDGREAANTILEIGVDKTKEKTDITTKSLPPHEQASQSINKDPSSALREKDASDSLMVEGKIKEFE